MKTFTVVFIAVAILLMSLSFTGAQDLPKAAKYTNMTWYSIGYYKFKPGEAENAQKLIANYFMKADKAAGRGVINFNLVTGEWDHIALFPLDGGASGLEWSVGPSEEKWWAELAKLAGGAAKAQDLNKRFNEMIANSKTEVAMRPAP
jgi:hypothetical protein